MSEGNLKIVFYIHVLTPIPDDIGPIYINLAILQTMPNSNEMITPLPSLLTNH